MTDRFDSASFMAPTEDLRTRSSDTRLREIPRARMAWTLAECECLERLLKDGLSASEIGAALGCSRNAVIGKSHRMGYAGNGPPRRPTRPKLPRKPRSPRLRATRQSTAKALFREPAAVVTSTKPVSLFDLSQTQCRWVLEGIMHCGEPVLPPFYFCAGHARLAYQPGKKHREIKPPHVRISRFAF